jgi:hypothetical protein
VASGRRRIQANRGDRYRLTFHAVTLTIKQCRVLPQFRATPIKLAPSFDRSRALSELKDAAAFFANAKRGKSGRAAVGIW